MYNDDYNGTMNLYGDEDDNDMNKAIMNEFGELLDEDDAPEELVEWAVEEDEELLVVASVLDGVVIAGEIDVESDELFGKEIFGEKESDHEDDDVLGENTPKKKASKSK